MSTIDISKATLIGRVAGVAFYEHPVHGDESPLVAEHAGVTALTDYWELPEARDLAEWTPAAFVALYVAETR